MTGWLKGGQAGWDQLNEVAISHRYANLVFLPIPIGPDNVVGWWTPLGYVMNSWNRKAHPGVFNQPDLGEGDE